MEIKSLQNKHVKQALKYHYKKYRDLDQRFLIEGEHLVEEAAKANILICLFVLQGYHHPYQNIETFEVSATILKKISQQKSAQTILAIARMPKHIFDPTLSSILLDDIQDPGNLGTIIRSALSFQFQQVVCSPGCCDIYNEKLIRSTQGALFHIIVVPYNLFEAISQLQKRKVIIFGTALKAATDLKKVVVKKPFAIVFGNEGQGIHPSLLAKCDEHIRIEMKNFESLNVGVAASICMYTLKK